MIIAVPSKGRAGKTKTLDFLKSSATLFVPQLEADAYARTTSAPIVAVPDTVLGITRTRNWVLDYAAEHNERHVVMVDDDLKAVGWIEMLSHSSKHRDLSARQVIAEWEKLFDITEDLHLHLWGVSTDGAPRSVYTYRPFLWHTYVTGSCMGIVNDGIRFDPSFPVKEDYELCLRCIRDDGAVVGARYLYWINDHWSKEGGCRTYRTQVMEQEAIFRLISMYPGLIRRVTRGGSEYSIELDF